MHSSSTAAALLLALLAGCSATGEPVVPGEAGPPSAEEQPLCGPATVQFEFDSFALPAAARPTLERIARCLAERPEAIAIVCGHTATAGTEEYNIALSDRLAKAVGSWLEKQGIERKRLKNRAMGESQPLCRELSESCQSRNRRVEITIE